VASGPRKARAAKAPEPSSRFERLWVFLKRPWVRIAAAAFAVPAIAAVITVGHYYVKYGATIDARLHGERERVLPRVFARPFELHRGQAMTDVELIDRLNDLGYAQRARLEKPGEFAIGRNAVALIPREGGNKGQVVRVVFQPARRQPSRKTPAPPPPTSGDRIDHLETPRGKPDTITLDAPLLTALIATGREKRRQVPLDSIPPRMREAVLAIEDRRFYEHPGVDPIGALRALVTNMRGEKKYLTGGSTITQQLVKNFFLTQEKTLRRKLLEQFIAVILETRASKDEILELYLNDVYLGNRGSFAIHGVAEAARLFFGKDVSNVSLSEAATIAGVIQSPGNWSPFASPERARERRNVVLQAMADSGFIAQDAADRAAHEPVVVVQRALEAEAPYFVDYVGQVLSDEFPAVTRSSGTADVYTTLDLHLQRLAQDAVRDGLTHVDGILSRRRKRPRQAQAALIAADPRTGEILAFVGGRSYNQSQYDRAVAARRQPGSVFKPFVYLSAFERGAEEGRTDLTPATLVIDEPTTFSFEEKAYNPSNYENEYDGPITLRRALALSRNVATIKVAESAGFDHVAALWKKLGTATPPRPYPSIALGVFEATPFEVTTAYTLFANGGQARLLRPILRIVRGENDAIVPPLQPLRTVARPDTTFLVTNMMRSVINEGTGAGARAAGFTLDAAGKSGTTNDLRDAWFVGFTPELLTVVWVGLDDNQPLGLSGSQAALPIWTRFMIRALAGHPSRPFEPPDGITFADIDRDTGKLAVPGCPRVFHEAFLAGTEPVEACELHRW
jgi:penicillin-binding protein 1B